MSRAANACSDRNAATAAACAFVTSRSASARTPGRAVRSASASAARTSWVALRDQLPADQRFGVGGSGSDTAANLSGQSGTNQTKTGRENYNIDTQNTDPNHGPMSTNPALYDDKALFNLL